MKSQLLYYIKERHNPQLGVYFIACGQMTKKAAKAAENAIYGYNVMRSFDTQEEYEAACKEWNAKP